MNDLLNQTIRLDFQYYIITNMYRESNRKNFQQSQDSHQTQRMQNKENIPLKVNYEQRKDKKFTYGFLNQKNSTSSRKKLVNNSNNLMSKDEQIQKLKRQLQEEREKVKYLQSTIIQEQSLVLQHLQLLQRKFQEVSSQKNRLQVELHRLKNQRGQLNQQSSEYENWKEKYTKLDEEHKKIKNIAEQLVKMMKKVDGVQGDMHQAWKWVKKVIWQYEGIRTKALQWKAVYDQINEAVNLIEK